MVSRAATWFPALVSAASLCFASAGCSSLMTEEEGAGELVSLEAKQELEAFTQRARLRVGGTEVGGIINVFDGRLANVHAANGFFVDRHFNKLCAEDVALPGGGVCHLEQPCPPAPPRDPGQPLDVGTLLVASSFDTISIPAPNPLLPFGEYPEVDRPGSFWTNGAPIVVTYTGRLPEVLPFLTVLRAPVRDAVASPPLPSVVDRAETLSLGWTFGPGPAHGKMLLNIVQLTPDLGIECEAPITQRSITVPASLLAPFSPGEAFLFFQSDTATLLDPPVQQGKAEILLHASAEVDDGTGQSNFAHPITFE